ncbi:hypothetical protein [Sporolituus thermophilus]|uniref:Uncharacterized protein n=1 Tax=Sporolituus thermophilus DSM 23256 TaxID=1123285 RepID=A0A1G7JAA1_9FIRM|nr:hypothetical protein [Sporolituus thermophilus]SDF21835.1 hypothetical protein SAMN05660235_00848 [Sporolituus thermophilus DSM 23256]
MTKALVWHYAIHLAKLFTVGYIFYRLGKKFHATNPYWHYLIPIWNYVILCRCARISPYYAVGYHAAYFAASVLRLVAEYLKEPALANIWLCLFILCILAEAEIFGNLAERLKKDFWLYGLSGFMAYFPLALLVLSKNEPEEALRAQPPLPDNRSDYHVY